MDTLEERDRVEAHYQTTIFDMKSMLEERIKRADDISKAYKHFKMEVAKSAEHSKSGRAISEKLLAHLEQEGGWAHCNGLPGLRRLLSQLITSVSALLNQGRSVGIWWSLPHCGVCAVVRTGLNVDVVLPWLLLTWLLHLLLVCADQEKEEEVQRVRLKNIHLGNQLKRIEQTLRQKEELAEGLHLIDFEQLKIENQSLNEKIEERNEELLKLRKKTTTTVQVGAWEWGAEHYAA